MIILVLGHKVQILYIKRGIECGALLLHFIPTLGSNTEEIPLDTQEELCWYCYLKIYTPRKCSATAMPAFFFFFLTKQNKTRISIWIYLFPFLWQMSINSLAVRKYISILGEDNFFVFAKNHTDVHQWKNYTVYCLDDVILNVSHIWKNRYTIYYYYY